MPRTFREKEDDEKTVLDKIFSWFGFPAIEETDGSKTRRMIAKLMGVTGFGTVICGIVLTFLSVIGRLGHAAVIKFEFLGMNLQMGNVGQGIALCFVGGVLMFVASWMAKPNL